jgi:hypothetical protein
MADRDKKTKQPFQWSRFAGYVLFVFGILNLADLFSPARTPVAVALGSISIACAVILLLPGKMALLRRIASSWKKTAQRRELRDPMLPVKIIRLAKEHGGILTLSAVATELDVPLDEAQAGLDECVQAGQAAADFDMTKEVKFYRFQEHLAREKHDESIDS